MDCDNAKMGDAAGAGMKNPERESQVSEQMAYQQKCICILEGCVNQLSSKIESILTPEAPRGVTDEKEEFLVELAQNIRDSNRRIEAVSERLNDIMKRMEL